MNKKSLKIAVLSPHVGTMGDTRSLPMLARGLSDLGHSVDLLQSWKEWNHVGALGADSKINIVSLKSRWFLPVLPNISRISSWASYRVSMAALFFALIPGLVWYLYREKPDVLIVRMVTGPIILIVKFFRPKVKVIVSSSGLPRHSRFRDTIWPFLYGKADGFIVAAPGVAEMVSDISKIPVSEIAVLWEAVIDDEMVELAKDEPTHPWFSDGGAPVVMGMGRFTRQKDLKTLIQAFAKARRSTDMRLVIFGEGEERNFLQAEINRLGLDNDVDLPGFIDNPYSHLASCDVFVLSSIWESSCHSLIEAQGLGVPSITTDCPSGQSEIALEGDSALVVPVGDSDAMGDAIARLVIDREEADRLGSNALENSHRFWPDTVSKEWEKKIVDVINSEKDSADNTL
jgi:glycosyltransferase involved in cell wall biosynthesis